MTQNTPATQLNGPGVLFPRLNGLFGNACGAEWEATWSVEERVSAPSYFWRYFQCAVPAGDTSPVVR